MKVDLAPAMRSDEPHKAQNLGVIQQVLESELETEGGDLGEVERKEFRPSILRLQRQLNQGIEKPGSLNVVGSASELLPPELLDPDNSSVVPSEDIPEWGYSYSDPETGKRYELDGHRSVVSMHRKMFGNQARVRLVKYGGELLTVTDQACGDSLRIIQVMEPSFYSSESEMVREQIRVKHLVIEDSSTGKAFDFSALLPDDWSLLMFSLPQSGQGDPSGFECVIDHKKIAYTDLRDPVRLVALLHEYGHGVYNANDADWPKAQLLKLGAKARFGAGRLTDEEYDTYREIKAVNERGAWARALQLMRDLGRQGINIDMPIPDLTAYVDRCLDSYERKMGSMGYSFASGRRVLQKTG